MGTTNVMGLPFPENTDAVANGALAMKNLALGVDAKSGLVLVKSQLVGATAVPSVAVTSAFSNLYDNYLITYTGGIASVGGAQLRFALNIDTANAYYSNTIHQTAGVSTPVGSAFGPLTGFAVVGYVDTGDFSLTMNINNPNRVLNTNFSGSFNCLGGSSRTGTSGGWSIATGANTGFIFYPSSGNLTNGVIRVYGVHN
jgi:hypothetical protein